MKKQDIEARKALMNKKHKRLYQRIEKGEKKKADRIATLESKKKVVKGGKKKVAKKAKA